MFAKCPGGEGVLLRKCLEWGLLAGRKFSGGVFLRKMSGGNEQVYGIVWGWLSASLCSIISLRVAAVIWPTLVNTQTHRFIFI